MKKSTKSAQKVTYGLDLGGTFSHVFGLGPGLEVVADERIDTSAERITSYFGALEPALVVLEAGPTSRWVHDVIEECGHEVLVANPRQIPSIYASTKKTDRHDAEILARLGRVDPQLLAPIKLRSLDYQVHLSMVRTRALLVSQRTELINHTRSICTGFGHRLPKCDGHYFHRKVANAIPDFLEPLLSRVLEQIGNLTEQIKRFDKEIEALCETEYPETANLRAVQGVGALIALVFVLTLHDPKRFATSRKVGAFLGLVPRLDHSCTHAPQLRITKAGDSYLRQLLVSAAHYILGPFGPDCDLRRHGQRI